MAYSKLTFKDFKARLDNGDYSIAGARRAVGKSSWEDDDKQKARDLIDKHFGEAAAKPASKKASKKKAAKKTAKTASKKAAGKKKAAKKRAAKKAPKASKKAAKRGPKRAYTRRQPVSNAASADPVGELARIHLVGERVGTVTQAIKAMEKASEHGADIKDGMQRAQNVLAQSVAELEQHVNDGANGTSNDDTAKKFAESASAAVAPSIAMPAEFSDEPVVEG